MSKVEKSKIFYKKSDFVIWLAGEMKERHLTQRDIGKWLGVASNTAGQKMRECSFRYTDMLIIFQELGTDRATQIRLMLL